MSLKWDFPGVKAPFQKRPSGFVTFFNNRRRCKYDLVQTTAKISLDYPNMLRAALGCTGTCGMQLWREYPLQLGSLFLPRRKDVSLNMLLVFIAWA